MAVKKSKVKVEVDVDDKGTTKKVGLGAKKAGEGLDKTATSAHSADRRLKGTAQASSNTTKNFSKMSQGITGGLVPAYATLAANLFAVSAAFEFFKRAADLRNLQKSQLNYAASTGTALGSITGRLREASGGMLSFQSAAQASAMGLAKGFSPKQMEQLTVGARKTSAAMGISFQEAFDRLVRGVSKAEPELLDELGITLRLADAAKEYGRTINKNAKDLTVAEKGQAVFADVMGKINDQFGEVETQENVFVKLGVTFSDIGRTLAEKLLPAFEAFAKIIQENTTSAIAVLGLFAASILRSISPFEKLTASASKFFAVAKSGFKSSIGGLKGAFSGFGEQTAAGAKVRGVLEEGTTSRVAGLERAGTDETLKAVQKKGVFGLTKRQFANFKKGLKTAEADLKRHGAVQRGIFAGASRSQIMFFKLAINANKVSLTKFGTFAKVTFKSITATAKVAFHGIRLAGTVAFGAIAGAARLAGGAMNAAMRLAGFVGIAMIAIDAFKAMKNNISSVIESVINGFVAIARAGFKAINFFRKKFGMDELVFDAEKFRESASSKVYGTVGTVAGFVGADLGDSPEAVKQNVAAYQAEQKQQEFEDPGMGSVEKSLSELDKIRIGIKEAEGDVSKVQRNLLNAAATFDFEGMFEAKGIDQMRIDLADLAAQSPRIAEALEKGTLEAIQNINTEAGIFKANIADIKDQSRDFDVGSATGGQMLSFAFKRQQDLANLRTQAKGEDELAELDKLEQKLPSMSQMIEDNSRGIMDYLDEAGTAFTDNLSKGMQGLIRGTMTAKEAFRGLANSILDSLAKVASDKMTDAIFGAIMDSDFVSGLGIFDIARYGKVPQMALGGVAKGPDAGYPTILHGTEAVVPLPDGKTIPVQMKGSMGDQNNITINISGDGTATAEGTGNNNETQKELGKAVAVAVQQELIKQKRPGGILSPYGAA